MASSTKRRTNIAKHKEQILNVINKLSEEELEQVSDMLKQSDANAEEEKTKEELEDEYAAAIMRDAEGLNMNDAENVSACPSS
jgi:histidyl-tRNA synthetase